MKVKVLWMLLAFVLCLGGCTQLHIDKNISNLYNNIVATSYLVVWIEIALRGAGTEVLALRF